MKKILLIGQLTDVSGYGYASRSYLKTLSEIKNIELKCLNFSFEKKEIFNDLVEKLSLTKSTKIKRGNYTEAELGEILDFVDEKTEIIFFLTNDWLSFGSHSAEIKLNDTLNLNLLCKKSKHVFPCVVWETDSVPDIWLAGYHSLNNIKKIICACNWNAEVFSKKINKECVILPYTLQRSNKYDTKFHEKLKKIKKTSFAFCNVSQWSSRKGMEELIRSFYLEFHDEDVVLFLKTYINQAILGTKNCNFLKEKILQIKNSISHYGRETKFRCKVILIDEILSKEQINSIYKVSDAYATCTKGEGFGLPIAEFLINTDRPVVVPDKGGHLDFINDNNFFIESSYEPALIPSNHHYSEIEMNYVQVKISSTKEQLRAALNYDKQKKYSDLCHEYLSNENNVKIMKEILELE